MKLSLSWIFDHIKGTWKDYSVDDIIARFNQTTAEIEQVEKVSLPLDEFTLATVTQNKNGKLLLESLEWDKEFELPARTDGIIGNTYLIVAEKKNARWVLLTDLHAQKDGLVPALSCSQDELSGTWKNSCESEDYILLVDNKSVTNRPDLWGHRGFAREIAAILEIPFLPEERFLASKPIKHYASLAPATSINPISLEIEATACKRLAGLYMNSIANRPSLPWMASRLARIDGRPLDLIVDMTNYVMYDIGQPMHAFDTKKVASKKIIASWGKPGEKLLLLDGTEITLTPKDCVIREAEKVMGLAGIMGGKESGIQSDTRELILESANFDATTIRHSSTHFKLRTEASARFEKSLDPNQNTQALLRFLKLLDDAQIPYESADSISSVGPLAQEKIVTISHEFIGKRLGMSVTPDMIIKILTKIGFGVQSQSSAAGQAYIVTIPTYRCSKDVTIKEDILEEIARFIGYTNIPQQLPMRQMKPLDHSDVLQVRKIKQHCAYALGMHEVYNYTFYDEEFLKLINFESHNAIMLKNPLSEHWRSLITSLVPHLMKNIYQNIAKQQSLRFFEWSRVWDKTDSEIIVEHKKLAGIFFEQKTALDFYVMKAHVQSLFDVLNLLVDWRKPQGPLAPWWSEHQTAELVCDGIVIGYAGMLAPLMLATITEGEAFAFELDGDFLMQHAPLLKQFEPLSKYQTVALDMSMLIAPTITVAAIEKAIIESDARIRDLILIDYFEKEEWGDQRSVTMRSIVADEHKTLTKEEINEILNTLVQAVTKIGAVVR